VNYTVQTGDTLPSIATNMAAAITADTNLQSLGVNAAASSNQMNIKSTSANLTTYSASTSGGATESIALGISTNAVQNATIGGSVTAGNVLTINVNDQGLAGGTASVSYTATGTDTLNSIASQLASAVDGSSALSAAGITATATQNVVHVKSTSSNLTTYSQSLSSGATETIYLALDTNGPETFLLGGSKTTGNVLGIMTYDQNLSGASESISYTVQSTDTLTTIAAALTSAINSDTSLQNIGVSATSSGQLITVTSLSTGVTSYRASRPATATETIVQGLNPNGGETAVIGGTKHNNDVLTITVFDAGLAGGSKAKSYTVHAADTLATIASSLANKIASDSDLSALGITATAASTVVNLGSTSSNLTTYTSSLSAGATETITLGSSTGITAYAYNNLNELTSTTGGGLARFQGTTNKPIKSATIGSSVSASLPSSTSFSANTNLSAGSNSATVNAIDGNNNSLTNTYQLSVKGGPTATLTFDANGNMTSDGTNSYAWDAENRLIKITYPGSGNYSQFAFDGFGRNVLIQEYTSSTLTSTRQFVWSSGTKPKEARDSSSSIISQYFALGQMDSSNKRFYNLNQVGSTTEVTDNSGTVLAQFAYSPFGQQSQLQGSYVPDFGFAGYYLHARSGLSLTLHRAYSASLGRFLNRDRLGGANPFAYCKNSPGMFVDPDGEATISIVLTVPEVAAWAIGLTALLWLSQHPEWILITPANGSLYPSTGGGSSGGGIWGGLPGWGAPSGDAGSGAAGGGGNVIPNGHIEVPDTHCKAKGHPPSKLPPPPPIPDDPTQQPADGWTWRGPEGSQPGVGPGGWVSPDGKESLSPDLDNPVHGPHWDYNDSLGNGWRYPAPGYSGPPQWSGR
jgi:RHS repeat-associated protein